MGTLEDVSTEELETGLTEIEGYREARRLLAAIIYKRGPSVPMIAEWLDVREATVYEWFDRLETEPLAEAVRDEPRPGRPSKLGEEQWEQFRAAVTESPEELGYDASAWTGEIARQYLEATFGVVYSARHARRLVTKASGGEAGTST